MHTIGRSIARTRIRTDDFFRVLIFSVTEDTSSRVMISISWAENKGNKQLQNASINSAMNNIITIYHKKSSIFIKNP